MSTNAEKPAKATVLVVDDSPETLQMMNALLKQHYHLRLATHGEAALRIARQSPYPDLILLDIMMPGIDGYEVCRQLKADPNLAELPVIFLTAKDLEQDEEHGFRCGCVDYITKPISPSILMARVATHLALKAANDKLRNNNVFLMEEVARRTHEVQMVQDVTILAMASLAETRDNETGMHLRRTQHYVRALAEYLARLPRFSGELTPEQIEILYKSAPLHDIGKVGIPDAVLLKPGPLTYEEFELMKGHAALGRDTIRSAETLLYGPSNFLTTAREIAYHHHERWDGKGYPDGLAGEAIPLAARLMAVADVYDAMISTRVYKKGVSHEETVAAILAERGKAFDPAVVDAFAAIAEEFRAIAQRVSDQSTVGAGSPAASPGGPAPG